MNNLPIYKKFLEEQLEKLEAIQKISYHNWDLPNFFESSNLILKTIESLLIMDDNEIENCI